MPKFPLTHGVDFMERVFQFGVAPFMMDKAVKLMKPVGGMHPVNLQISPKEFKKLQRLHGDRLAEGTLKAVVEGSTKNVVSKNGKLFFRETDNSLIRDKQGITKFPDLMRELTDPNDREVAIRFNEAVHGKKLFAPDGSPLNVEAVDFRFGDVIKYSDELTHIVQSSRKVGNKGELNVVLQRQQPLSWFPKPATSYDPSSKTLRFDPLYPGDAYHELTHAKNFESPAYRIGMAIPEYLGTGLTYAFPTAYLAGNDIKEKIPGKVDDAIVDAVKKFGPELYLASRIGTNLMIDERSAFNNTKKLLSREYGAKKLRGFDVPNSSLSAPGTPLSDILKGHKWNLATYPVVSGMVYGGMRGGAALYEMDKEGSLSGDVAKGPFLAIGSSFKRFLESIPHTKQILKSIVMSSPDAPQHSLATEAIRLGVPIGLLYGVDYSMPGHGFVAADAQNKVMENML